MINKSILFHAKSFLCWDKFPELSIKLIPIQDSVGFFYPPQVKFSSIVLFYDAESLDLTEPLCLLFHEVGHYLQWEPSGLTEKFRKLFDLDKGKEKIAFELEAWTRGEELFIEFLEKEKINKDLLLEKYNELKDASLATYEN